MPCILFVHWLSFSSKSYFGQVNIYWRCAMWCYVPDSVNTIFHNMMTLEAKSNDTKCILLPHAFRRKITAWFDQQHRFHSVFYSLFPFLTLYIFFFFLFFLNSSHMYGMICLLLIKLNGPFREAKRWHDFDITNSLYDDMEKSLMNRAHQRMSKDLFLINLPSIFIVRTVQIDQ